MKIVIEKCIYKVHPVYDLYAANEEGKVIHLARKEPLGRKKYNGYMICNVKKFKQSPKTYYIHRFVWECFNGSIPCDKVIDHINDIKDDNRLCNLQLITPKENVKKSVKNRDYSFAAKNHQNKKSIKATNINNNEVSYYNSLYAVQQHLGINAGIVKMISEKLNNCKTGISKKNGNSYKFEYVKEDDMPDNYKKSANIKPKRVSDEDKKKHAKESIQKWKNKEFTCSICNKIYKNGYKYLHTKICERNNQKQ